MLAEEERLQNISEPEEVYKGIHPIRLLSHMAWRNDYKKFDKPRTFPK